MANDKYHKATLPASRIEALTMATEREFWAKEAREKDHHGTARELELTALLLRFFATQGPQEHSQ